MLREVPRGISLSRFLSLGCPHARLLSPSRSSKTFESRHGFFCVSFESMFVGSSVVILGETGRSDPRRSVDGGIAADLVCCSGEHDRRESIMARPRCIIGHGRTDDSGEEGGVTRSSLAWRNYSPLLQSALSRRFDVEPGLRCGLVTLAACVRLRGGWGVVRWGFDGSTWPELFLEAVVSSGCRFRSR